jgi:hypothetical protein
MSERSAFEAKVHAKRETKEGRFVTLMLHPNDDDPWLAIPRVGATVMGAVEEVLNVKVEPLDLGASSNGKTSASNSEDAGSTPAASARIKRKFAEMSLPEQCALRCGDGRFIRFVDEMYRVNPSDPETTEDLVKIVCGVKLKRELSTNHDAANQWRQIESNYQRWLTDETYKESVR